MIDSEDKYVDAEKLIAEIERRREKCADIAAHERNEEVAEYYRRKEVAYDEISSLITSLQQEQAPTEREIAEAHRYAEMIREKDKTRVQPEVDIVNTDNRIQYASIEGGIKAHAEIYSFNIDSQLFPQLTKEQQVLWRKEIEQACISGGEVGVELAKDVRYKENQQPEVDLKKEIEEHVEGMPMSEFTHESEVDIHYDWARKEFRYFFELGLNVRKK